MTLPINLVLVRHGQSEGNAAKRLSEAGDNRAYSDAFRARHSSSFRLTDRGRQQAVQAGNWINQEFFGPKNDFGFDRFVTSEYTRAMETAGLLNLPAAKWYCDSYLTERDWGALDNLPEDERQEKFGEALRGRDVEPFFWRPPNGESFAQLCLRVDRVLDTLHRECSDSSVILVCHGETMRAFQVRLERMSQVRFKDLAFSENQADRIHNCEVLHYTRRNPVTGEKSRNANWFRKVRPVRGLNEEPWTSGWLEIERPTYSNDDLLSTVSLTPLMVA